MWAFIAHARHLKSEAMLSHSQISAKYLINFTPNCYALAVAVISAKLGSNAAGKYAKFFHVSPYGQFSSILHGLASRCNLVVVHILSFLFLRHW